MRLWEVMGRDWKIELGTLLSHAEKDLVISSPYITKEGSGFILGNLREQALSRLKLRILTDLSPLNICYGSTDPDALKSLTLGVQNTLLSHLPRLHAKVYVADSDGAIVTSANLTGGGLERNYEYGVKISDRKVVREIARDIASYSELGALVSAENLDSYCEIAKRLRTKYASQEKSIARSVKKEFQREVLTAEDELVRLRLAGGAMHTVFARTILYLLRRYGPLRTTELHPKVQAIHPDLCDDTIDRVIDGERFGKKWKHAVRTAQQQLKKQGLISLSDDVWLIP